MNEYEKHCTRLHAHGNGIVSPWYFSSDPSGLLLMAETVTSATQSTIWIGGVNEASRKNLSPTLTRHDWSLI